MTPKRYQQICQLFHQALEVEESLRDVFLTQACAGDEELRAAVERMLMADSQEDDFIAAPALEVAAQVLAENTNLVGQRIRHYQIISLLGVGGMGEVYLAEDTQLARHVAVKLLPAAFSHDQERVRRFEQEARAASALNHPGIITIHEIGIHENTRYIVTEFIAGCTLRQQMNVLLSLEQVLDLTIQISSALEAAHVAGIVHRDLKPENIMVRPDGLVKVLDFGLARLSKRRDRAAAPLSQTSAGSRRTSAKTVNTTTPGIVLGTIGYMSPEQAVGEAVDHRTDIFSLGVILYEMLTGNQPFAGNDSAATLRLLLSHHPPPVTRLRPDMPEKLQWIIDQTLEKDRELRCQSAADLKASLKALQRDSGTRPAVIIENGKTVAPWKKSWLHKTAGVIGILLLAFTVWLATRFSENRSALPRLASFTQITMEPGEEFDASLSADGRQLVYTSYPAGNKDIYLRRVGGTTSINLTADTSEDDSQPDFSPDDEQIAFRSERDGGGIFLMGATGENVRRLTRHGFHPAWSPDGQMIAFSSGDFSSPSTRSNYPSPLWILDLATGTERQVISGDVTQPAWSPHALRIAYWGLNRGGQRDIWTVSVQGGNPVQVTDDAAIDWNPVWSRDGRYLYYVSDRAGSMNMWRIAINEETGYLSGKPEAVTTPATHTGYISFSRDGKHLAYSQAINQTNILRLAFDPTKAVITGAPEWVTPGSRVTTNPELSPDGAWLAYDTIGEKQEDIFLIRPDGTGLRQLTSDGFKDRLPRWSPRGDKIIFFSDRSGRYEQWLINPDGTGLEQLTRTDGPGMQAATWSPSGDRIVFGRQSGPQAMLSLAAPHPITTLQFLPDVLPNETLPISWSSDGRRILSEGNGIFSFSLATNTAEKLLDFGDRPYWLPDNRRAIFFSAEKIYLLDTQTRKLKELFRAPSGTLQSISLSKDYQTIYYSLRTRESDIWLATLE